MRRVEDLIDLDLDFYKTENIDLASFTDTQLTAHYFEHGYKEGRANSRIAVREEFVESLPHGRTLEIGPFCSPSLVGRHVEYADYLSTEELRVRAAQLGMNATDAPPISHVLREKPLSSINERYDVVFSSHNFEHQPDIVHHLQEVRSILRPRGRLALIVPNALYCFDARLPLSKVSEVLSAHRERRRTHSFASIIEHRALTTHNDSGVHWAERLSGRQRYVPIDSARVRSAIAEFDSANGTYIDVHAWQFDPVALSDILHCVIDLGLVDFRKVQCNGPVRGTNEFTVTLFA